MSQRTAKRESAARYDVEESWWVDEWERLNAAASGTGLRKRGKTLCAGRRSVVRKRSVATQSACKARRGARRRAWNEWQSKEATHENAHIVRGKVLLRALSNVRAMLRVGWACARRAGELCDLLLPRAAAAEERLWLR